jgi:hypothetical protein
MLLSRDWGVVFQPHDYLLDPADHGLGEAQN